MLTFWEKIIFIIVILITICVFFYPILYRYRIISSGLSEERFDKLWKRFKDTLAKVFLQKCTLKNERIATGFIHCFIFYGALTFDTITINHTLEGFIDNFYLFGNTNFALFFSLIVDIFTILVLAGVVFFVIRRFIQRSIAYATTHLDSAVIYILIATATLSYLYFESFAIANNPETQRLSFLGITMANIIKNAELSVQTLAVHLKISWWLHIFIVYSFIAYVPHSKYLHMFTGPLNVFFSSPRAGKEIKSIDIERAEVFGVEKASDFTWKDFLDAFACMECGRCQDVCPAFASEKPLSPKMIIFNLENHLLNEGLKLRKRDEMKPLMEGVYSEDEIWTCTTCGACMHVCPVEIEHIPKIIGVRQSRVLMESKFPQELNTFFRNMETNSNPWGIGFASRADWAESLDVKFINDHPDAEYLFWVGCAGSYDDNGKKITKALVSIMNKAKLDFAILGTEEKCCGDSARRLGNEYLFQMLATENFELFKKYRIKKIITMCPHGYNTFKNEYPRLLGLLPTISSGEKDDLKKIEVIHHVQLLHKLAKEGKLSLNPVIENLITYHDSCYLARHNKIFNDPREILSKISTKHIVELKNNKEHSFCCGAGGGLMWTEEAIGKRINHIRTDEVISSQAEIITTSCPFCLTMLQDGLKDKEKTEIKVKDIAELVEEAIFGEKEKNQTVTSTEAT
ncbi:MAG: heterodisulfide reductase-related iron-sulfur binding cluster [Candidatus Aminicenantaceae bacterium]